MIYDLSQTEQEAYGFGQVLPLCANGNGNLVYAFNSRNGDFFSFNWEGDILARFAWDELVKEMVEQVLEVLCDDEPEEEVLAEIRAVFADFEVPNIDDLVGQWLQDSE
jgi:hypothetical protein